ncbi:zinc ribbon domain-containing protein [bacterium]|nr:zinc ribbon domain-containing protein [bacterium]
MPTYEYQCQNCNYTFEEFQQMSAAPLTTCPKCSGTLKRLIGTGAGILFKGSGFYYTDYVKKNSGSSESDSSKSSAKSTSDSTASENKSAAKKSDE